MGVAKSFGHKQTFVSGSGAVSVYAEDHWMANIPKLEQFYRDHYLPALRMAMSKY